jgi:uncharacterized ParB-like nuclease family protein
MAGPFANEKIIVFSCPKGDSKQRSYISEIQTLAKNKTNAGQYSPVDAEGFKNDPKRIHFAQTKSKKISMFEQHASQQSSIPAMNQYSPKRASKVTGSIKL